LDGEEITTPAGRSVAPATPPIRKRQDGFLGKNIRKRQDGCFKKNIRKRSGGEYFIFFYLIEVYTICIYFCKKQKDEIIVIKTR
jgi:hypothetical protein